MVNKIIDVPEGAEEFLFEAYKTEILVGKTQEGYLSSLPDAPKKRVIVLPIEDIYSLENAKSDATDVSDFIGLLFGTEYQEPSFPLSTMIEVNLIADWYLHPEFVELRKSSVQKYMYKLRGFYNQYITEDTSGRLYTGVLSAGKVFKYQAFTRDEIEKLASENGFKLSAFEEIEVNESSDEF